jgi:hypothetical protein
MNKKANYPQRSVKDTGLFYRRTFWERYLDISQKVVVYWPEGPNDVTVVGYYATVSAANTAAVSAKEGASHYPRVEINRWHSSFTFKQIGPKLHRDATVDLPAWYDAQPGWQFA